MAVEIQLNHLAIGELLKSLEVMAALRSRGDAIAAAAGHGVTVEERIGKSRARVSVRADVFSARVAESEDKILTRALDAGRG